jgi:transcriptional regulator with GAF, ATPase, and Fis domain
VIELDDPTSVFTQCVGQKKSFWVNTPTSNECKVQVDDVLVERFSQHGFLLAPLCVGHKVLGLFYADRQGSERHFEQDDFDSFTHFSELANVCFRVSMT